jgi:nitrogen fixation-related uncharacterized protein
MRLRSFFSNWRRILVVIGAIFMVVVVCSVALFLWAINKYDDKEGVISSFKSDRSLILHRTSPGGISYTINNAYATFSLDVARQDKNCDRLFPNYAAALKFAKDAQLPSIPSVQLIHGKCKQFDDDLCATLEQVMETGSGHLPGKSQTLQHLLQKLIDARNTAPQQARPPIEEAILHVATAVTLGGGNVALDPALTAKLNARKADFLQKPVQADPIGFWTENDTLRRTFMQDRYLMEGIPLDEDAAVCIALARVISDDPELSRAFDLYRAVDSRLTNPPVFIRQDVYLARPARALSFREVAAVLPQGVSLPDLLTPANVQQTHTKLADSFGKDAGLLLISYSRSPEYGLLLDAISKGQLTGQNASLDLIIDAIRSGRLSLKPVPGSGWYDYQWYALETLLRPETAAEAPKLVLTDAYKKRLEEAFKSSVAKNRETHIKQLPSIMQGMSEVVPAPRVEIHPEFSAEPTITVYLRTARAYQFLHTALTAVLGSETLNSLRRTSPGNSPALDLGDELNRMSLLCYGIHNIVSTELGLLPSYLPDELSPAELREARQIASQWLTNAASAT